MTSILSGVPGVGGNGNYRLTGGPIYGFDSLKPVNAEQNAQINVDSSDFKKMAEMGYETVTLSPAAKAAYQAVQMNTMIRQNGQVVAVLWRDGQTDVSNAFAGRINFDGIDRQTRGMSIAERDEFVSQALIKAAGKTGTVTRFGNTGPSPTRADLETGRLGVR